VLAAPKSHTARENLDDNPFYFAVSQFIVRGLTIIDYISLQNKKRQSIAGNLEGCEVRHRFLG